MKTITKSRGQKYNDGPNPVDVAIGLRVKERRVLQGMSQENLGDAIGLTFQQIQKYERGTNRISSSKILQIAKALDVKVSFFFHGLEDDADTTTESDIYLTSRANLETVRDLMAMPEEQAKRLRAIVKSCAKIHAEAGAA